MIQRIQSLYLLVVAVLIAFIGIYPFAEILKTSDLSLYTLGVKGLLPDDGTFTEPLFTVTPVIVLASVSLVLALVAIFLYKKRMLQIRLCVFNIVLLVGLQGLMYYYITAATGTIEGESSFGVVFIFPLVSAILSFLALRAIAKDEALVRSLDRLR
ncbi:MAG: DUF4293 domain-containing protein [Bacteroidales bacterium]|nr:DUF4293 domain-containing protein [Bacteroidales bacterium]MBN2748897.1 DUF4293 domain-containing protein [Bacteroidales bacterium]